jgi:hypothetical protein
MQRYNIDGTLRVETDAERREREARHRGPLPISPAEALRRAKGAISGVTLSSKDEEEVLRDTKDPIASSWHDVPWHRSVDKLLFGRDGEAPFKRSDPRFNDFKGWCPIDLRMEIQILTTGIHAEFYKKYRALHLKKLGGSSSKRPLTEFEEIELGRNAMVLFQDFLNKKLESTRVKVERVWLFCYVDCVFTHRHADRIAPNSPSKPWKR